MTRKMKPLEIMNALNGLGRVAEREGKYVESNAKTKFTTGVAIAIAKNRRVLEHEFSVLVEIEQKNKSIAAQRGKEIKELPEQMELMDGVIDVEISTVSFSELKKGTGLTSEDFYDLHFMTNDEKEGTVC